MMKVLCEGEGGKKKHQTKKRNRGGGRETKTKKNHKKKKKTTKGGGELSMDVIGAGTQEITRDLRHFTIERGQLSILATEMPRNGASFALSRGA